MSWDFYIKRSSLAREDVSSLARGHVFSCKRRRVLSCKRRHVFSCKRRRVFSCKRTCLLLQQKTCPLLQEKTCFLLQEKTCLLLQGLAHCTAHGTNKKLIVSFLQNSTLILQYRQYSICWEAPEVFGSNAVKPIETMIFRDINFTDFKHCFTKKRDPRGINRDPDVFKNKHKRHTRKPNKK